MDMKLRFHSCNILNFFYIYRFQVITNVVKYAGMVLGIIGVIYAGFKYYDYIRVRQLSQEQQTGNSAIDLVEYY